MKFDHAIADPDWWYNKRLNEQHGGNRTRFGDGVWHKYATPPSDLETICSMPIATVMKDDSFLHLWTTGPHLFDAKEVMDSWGFTYITIEFVWVKIAKSFIKECIKESGWLVDRLSRGETVYDVLIDGTRKLPGHSTASNVEIVLLGKQGKPKYTETLKMYPQLIFSPLPKIPHTKPDRVHEYIDKAYPGADKIEFYARRQWKDWVCLGNEVLGQEGIDMRESIPIVRETTNWSECMDRLVREHDD
jgi:N6-adenosine-specific RNA methylase IME4